jgi:hypothetical protein
MSNRITKDEAARLSRQLVSPKQAGIDALYEAYKKKAFDIYNDTVPKEVHACFKKNPTWFKTACGIELTSHGFNRDYVSCPDDMEVICHDNDSVMMFTRETSVELMKAKRAWEKEKDAVEKTRNEIRNALINLHTYKRIIEQFPEAEPLLPKKYSPPAVNYSAIKPVIRQLAGALLETN